LFNIIIFLYIKSPVFIQRRCICDPLHNLRDVSVNCWELSFATTEAPGHHANESVVVYQRVARISLTRSSTFAAGADHALCDRVPNTFVEVFAIVEVNNSDFLLMKLCRQPLARGRCPPTAHFCSPSSMWNVCCYGNDVVNIYGANNLKSN